MVTINLAIGSIEDVQADTIILYLFSNPPELTGGAQKLNQKTGGIISELLDYGDFSGDLGQTAVLYPRQTINAKRIILVGAGKRDKLSLEEVRQIAATGIKKAQELHADAIALAPLESELSYEQRTQAMTEGILLSLYRYNNHKKNDTLPHPIKTVTFVESNSEQASIAQTAVAAGEAVCHGVALARDLVNMPPNIATPTLMAQTATLIASTYDMNILVGDSAWAASEHLGAYLAVAQGAGEPPKFIILEHNAEKRDELDTIILVGKGITFDTGGITLKPGANMGLMKSDMGGAAAVLGAMKAVGELNIPLHIVAITPCTENMPDANAYCPSDVIVAGNGKSIEIISTDAEGRMVLADALFYAQRYQPQAVIDLATLTGAAVIALGDNVAASIFTESASLQEKLLTASNTTHERLWPMPLFADYKEAIKSDVADMKNSGGRYGGLGTSASFLQEFTDDQYPWVHLDIAAMAFRNSEKGYESAGGTGFGVRLLVEFLRRWS